MKPENHDEEAIRAALKAAFPRVETKLRRDLWPMMRQRIHTPAARIPWYDWALAAGLALGILLFPKFVLLLAYHL